MLGIKDLKINRNKNLHSRQHLLSEDLSRQMLEPKNFAAYLGIAQLYPETELRALAKRVAAKKDLPAEARGKYFFGALKGLPRLRPGAVKSAARRNVRNKTGKK